MDAQEIKKGKGFTVMLNACITDPRISLKAKGIMSLMLSLPPDWEFNVRGLSTFCTDGRDSVASSLNELKKFGYLTVKQSRDGKGRVAHSVYVINQTPDESDEILSISEYKEDTPCTENPSTDKPDTEKPAVINTKTQNTDKIISLSDNLHHLNENKTEKKPEVNRGMMKKKIRENINYSGIQERNDFLEDQLSEDAISFDRYREELINIRTLDSVINSVTDAYCEPEDSVKVGSKYLSREKIIENFEALDSRGLKKITHKIDETKPEVPRNFILTMLYNL